MGQTRRGEGFGAWVLEFPAQGRSSPANKRADENAGNQRRDGGNDSESSRSDPAAQAETQQIGVDAKAEAYKHHVKGPWTKLRSGKVLRRFGD